MPTPEQQKLYHHLSGELQQLAHTFRDLLPKDIVSLHLHHNDGNIKLEAYGTGGKLIASLPDTNTPQPFREAIWKLGKKDCPDPDGIVCLL